MILSVWYSELFADVIFKANLEHGTKFDNHDVAHELLIRVYYLGYHQHLLGHFGIRDKLIIVIDVVFHPLTRDLVRNTMMLHQTRFSGDNKS